MIKKKRIFKDDPINNVKIVTVDNFQGEENDIIILSCVRSNQNNSIGFLKESNRVNVALSRAKYGLYVFGNASMIDKVSSYIMKKEECKR